MTIRTKHNALVDLCRQSWFLTLQINGNSHLFGAGVQMVKIQLTSEEIRGSAIGIPAPVMQFNGRQHSTSFLTASVHYRPPIVSLPIFVFVSHTFHPLGMFYPISFNSGFFLFLIGEIPTVCLLTGSFDIGGIPASIVFTAISFWILAHTLYMSVPLETFL